MKQYIKPTTDVQNIEVNAYMQTGSPDRVNVNNEKQTVSGAAKERDVWSEGYWN